MFVMIQVWLFLQ